MSTAIRLLAVLAIVTGFQPSYADDAAETTSSIRLFEQRIMPIFKSAKPSSCVQCHLSAVDLKNYILPSHDKTFLSLRDQGMINLNNPSESKILKLIRMGDKDQDKGARLIHEKTRRAEYEAFAAWIAACCNDPKLVSRPDCPRTNWQHPDPMPLFGMLARVASSIRSSATCGPSVYVAFPATRPTKSTPTIRDTRWA